MASFRDPARTFSPVEVIERLLEITDYYGHSPVPCTFHRAMIWRPTFDSFGFDIYSLTNDTSEAFETTSRIVSVLPNGSRSARERDRTLKKTIARGLNLPHPRSLSSHAF